MSDSAPGRGPSETPLSVPVAGFAHRHEAELAKGYLDDAGIPAFVAADDAGGAYGGLALSGSVRLLVRAEDAEEARRILEDAGQAGG